MQLLYGTNFCLLAGLLGDLEPLTTMNVSAVDVNHDEDDRSPEKEMGICSPRETQINVDFRKDGINNAAALPEKASLPGMYMITFLVYSQISNLSMSYKI